MNEDQEDEEGAGQFKLVQEQEKPHDDEEEEDPSDEDDVYADALIAKLQTSGMPIKKWVDLKIKIWSFYTLKNVSKTDQANSKRPHAPRSEDLAWHWSCDGRFLYLFLVGTLFMVV